ncbi:EAL domain-containing protein [Nodosilinea sp. E11]|uniref:EAL domain-containing protein n=1 Tax=Nodosilinea sp. E11 TaxID=3037479 RepID=UPI00293422D6|nr:EAL domain-containing protein [Nodosilinea sp. E11]WOD38194.1 EAL domain-containing protein [Nodosilinea sp. E11]
MISRFKRRLPLLASILGVSLIPPTIFLSISYFDYISTARASLRANVDNGVQRIDFLLKNGNDVLLDVARNVDPNDPMAKAMLERIVYDNPTFREIGIINDQGFLLLTSFGLVDPPKKISFDQRSNPNDDSLQILGPLQTAIMGEESIILSLPTQGLGEVNALVNPIILTEPWGTDRSLHLGTDGFFAYINTRSGEVLAGIGNIPSLETIKHEEVNKLIRFSRTSYNGDVLVISEVPRSLVLKRWRRMLFISGPIATLCSGLMFVLALQLVKQLEGLDCELKIGLENKELVIHYQPILNLMTRECVGSEALLRWYHPKQGVLSPGVFIPVAEKTGLINKIGEWVVKQAAQEQEHLYNQYSDLYTSINVSPGQLNSGSLDNLINWFQQPSETNQLCQPSRFVFEVTESAAAIRSGTITTDILSRLRTLGSRIALDDFGQGYSGLSYLHQLDIDILKIDRFYVAAINKNSQITNILESIIDLGHKMGFTMVAEGIETEEQHLFLCSHHVEYGQGWLYSRPIPIQEFEQFLIKSRSLIDD